MIALFDDKNSNHLKLVPLLPVNETKTKPSEVDRLLKGFLAHKAIVLALTAIPVFGLAKLIAFQFSIKAGLVGLASVLVLAKTLHNVMLD